MNGPKRVLRPDVPKAQSFVAAFCDDPGCGLHIIATDASGDAICEVVMSSAVTLDVIQLCKSNLYDKATRET